MKKGNAYGGEGWRGKGWMFSGRRVPNQPFPRVWPSSCPCLVTAGNVPGAAAGRRAHTCQQISAGTTGQMASGASYRVWTEGELSSGMHPALC